MKISLSLLTILLLCLFASCTEEEGLPDLEPAFATIEISNPDKSYTFLSGHIDEEQEPLLIDRIQDHGFVWSEQEGNSLEHSRVISLGKRQARYAYMARIKGLKGSTTYYARAYIIMNDQVFYANEITFRTTPGTWTRLADFPGEPIKNATGFSVNNKGYLVGETEVWEYEPEANSWRRKNDFPVTTTGATSFVIENIAYVYCGDLWKYDPAEDAWDFIASPQDEWRYLGCEGVTSFTSGGKAYLGGGRGNVNKRLLVYDPALNTWEYSGLQAPNVSFASGFSLDGRGYIVGGTGTGNSVSSTVLRYDIEEGSWEWMEPFRNKYGFESERTGMICFQFQNRVYLGMGYGTYSSGWSAFVGSQNDFYLYDPFEDSWKPQTVLVDIDERDDVKVLRRSGGVSFVIGDKGYMGLGVNRDYNYEKELMEEIPMNDFWEFSVR